MNVRIDQIVIWDGMEIIGFIIGMAVLAVGFFSICLWALARSIKRKRQRKKRRKGEKNDVR